MNDCQRLQKLNSVHEVNVIRAQSKNNYGLVFFLRQSESRTYWTVQADMKDWYKSETSEEKCLLGNTQSVHFAGLLHIQNILSADTGISQ
jgi:hypothetical protein